MIWQLLFLISNEVYYLFNRKRLDSMFKSKSPECMKKLDMVYYIVRLLSLPFVVYGLFGSMSVIFTWILSIWVFKIVLYHISERAYSFSTLHFPIFTLVNIVSYMTIVYFIIR